MALVALLTVLAARAYGAPRDPLDAGTASPTTSTEAADAADAADALDALDALAPAPVDPRRTPTLGFTVPVPAAHLVPPLPPADVVAAAYRAAGVADDPAHGWRVRSRLAALVPWVSLHDGRDATWRDVDDPTLGYTDVYDVRATWHLDRLVFDPEELRIDAMAISRRRDRRLVAAAAIHSYYEWLLLAAAAGESARWATRADEVRAELDAMTDGWFSEALAAKAARSR